MSTVRIMRKVLSPTKLNMYLDCPTCCWLCMNKGIVRPSGPFPSLPAGMDFILKRRQDEHRICAQIPPELQKRTVGKLVDSVFMRHFRDCKRFKFEEQGFTFCGAMDDCLVWDGHFIPVDFKTRGYECKESTIEFYRNQMDCYALLLERNKYPTTNFGYLIFYIPEKAEEDGLIRFKIDIRKITVNADRALKLLRETIEFLSGPEPSPNLNCEFCKWRTGTGGSAMAEVI